MMYVVGAVDRWLFRHGAATLPYTYTLKSGKITPPSEKLLRIITISRRTGPRMLKVDK